MKKIVENNITLEICPSSNIHNSVVHNIAELKKIIKTILKNKIKFTINTDGSEMYSTSIEKEQEFLLKNKILNREEVERCTKWSFEASFIK
jgi:adenosine deaminase